MCGSSYPLIFLSCILLNNYASVGVLLNDTLTLDGISRNETTSISLPIKDAMIISSSSSMKQSGNEFSTKRSETIKKLNLIKAKIIPTKAKPETIVQTYRVNDADYGTTCILMTVDALLSFIYTTKFNQIEESNTFVPSHEKISMSGDCSSGEKSSMILKWDIFELKFDFAKTPGGERWFVNGIQLNFNTKEKTFKQIIYDDKYIRTETTEGEILFPTPVGRSFKCYRELEINLIDPEYPDLKVKLLLRELTLEPFIFKNDDFGPEYLCSAPGVGPFGSEMAPFIFGSLLTVASLCTIGGYAVYRYLKVNKVQYDAME